MFIELKKNDVFISTNAFIPYNLIWKKDKDNYTNQARKVYNSIAKYHSTKKYGSNQMKKTNFDNRLINYITNLK